MAVRFRPARIEDLERADNLVVRSINDLTERHAFGPMAVSRPPDFQAFSLKDDPEGLWLAEDEKDMLGFAWSWVCDDLWFLAQLFVSPGEQGGGIGNQLLKRALEHARKSEATKKALITFTFNRVSQALYMRHGLFPRFPIYGFSAPRDALKDLRGAQLRFAPLEESPPRLDDLVQTDLLALGTSRDKHHRYLLKDGATNGFSLFSGDDCVGYVYISGEGHIGPLAVRKADALGPAFRTALNLAVDRGSSQISAFLPGSSEAALGMAVEHGMRITFPMLLMSNSNFGSNWTQYLPRNPGFM
jgi:ribosomal protein S18 acetylase RimI-like enzyme